MISANTAWNVHSRAPLLKAVLSAGWDIIALGAEDDYAIRIESELGIPFIPLEMKGDSTRLRDDVALFFRYLRLYRDKAPACVFHINNKPNIYGTLASSLLGIPSVSNITGLGVVAEKSTLMRFAVYSLYKLAFFSSKAFVFFQNADDRDFFMARKLVPKARTGLLPGSGVDTDRFTPQSERPLRDSIVFLFNGRLLTTKGIDDYIQAASRVRALCKNSKFIIIGEHDPKNSIFISRKALDEAIERGDVEWRGTVSDVRPVIDEADCVVLPSRYREGVPRSLLEAASMAKPLIACDSVGTREPVVDGVNGYLVKPADPEGLADAMMRFISLSGEERSLMGRNSRGIAVERFSVSRVIEGYVERLRAVTHDSPD
jgi:glycosyltransferase involved in cell wall biosynthesis